MQMTTQRRDNKFIRGQDQERYFFEDLDMAEPKIEINKMNVMLTKQIPII